MRRIFWLAMGLSAGAGVALMVSRWARRQAQRAAPANVARELGASLRSLGQLLEEARREFRAGVDEKEAELRASLPDGLAPQG